MQSAAHPRFLAPLPVELQAEVDRSAVVGGARLEVRDWEGAFAVFERVNDLLLERQPPNRRFHKGMPLHNMGLARILAGHGQDGYQFTLHAFAEDALSAGDERLPEGEEMRRPAAQNLLAIFGVEPDPLRMLGVQLRDLGATSLWRTPDSALAKLGARLVARANVEPPPEGPRKVGLFTSGWHERVFVGGPYRIYAVLNEIKKVVRALGFDAVMAADFDIPKELNHHHALLLLHECRLAIFEISFEAGQLMELERTRDYEIDPRDILVVHQAAAGHDPSVSGMLDALLGRLNVTPVSYGDIDDLPSIIEGFLMARGGR